MEAQWAKLAVETADLEEKALADVGFDPDLRLLDLAPYVVMAGNRLQRLQVRADVGCQNCVELAAESVGSDRYALSRGELVPHRPAYRCTVRLWLARLISGALGVQDVFEG